MPFFRADVDSRLSRRRGGGSASDQHLLKVSCAQMYLLFTVTFF